MQHYFQFLLALLLLLAPGADYLHAQDAGRMAVEAYEDGETALLNRQYKQAIRYFERALELNPDFTAANRALAAAYQLVNEYSKALENYQIVVQRDSFFSRTMYYELGELHYKEGNHDLALAYFNKFKQLQEFDAEAFGLGAQKDSLREAKLLAKVDGNIRACQVSMDSVAFLNITDITNLGPAINTKADEYFPFLSNDQQLLFYTRRRNAESDEDLYYSVMENGRWQAGSPVGAPFNTKENEGMSTVVRDGRRLYFTACRREGVQGTCDIWEALVNGATITGVQALQGYANSPKWESQACISCDGSTLYFASNRPGGRGGTDIWMSRREPDGSWGVPENLGPRINTPMDEEAPFITNDGNTLYFSSTGHLGMGEQDIFMSHPDANGNWGEAQNLRPPINTAFRELGFFLSADGRTGYFASNRPEGRGGMDIYKFDLSKQLYNEPITYVEGYLRDSVLRTPVSARVDFKNRPALTTGPDGRFFLCVRAGETLHLRVEADGYHPYQFRFPIPNWENRSFFTIEALLQPTISFVTDPEPTALTVKGDKTPKRDTVLAPRRPVFRSEFTHEVYFDFDATTVDPTEKIGLEQFLKTMKDKTIERVEVVGFADDIGTESYNLGLSEMRAKNIALILMENDLLVDQFYIAGKGEIKDDSPKAQNRRVEVKILTKEVK